MKKAFLQTSLHTIKRLLLLIRHTTKKSKVFIYWKIIFYFKNLFKKFILILYFHAITVWMNKLNN